MLLCNIENGVEDFWYEMEIKWKKIACMEYGKIVFHSISCPAFMYSGLVAINFAKNGKNFKPDYVWTFLFLFALFPVVLSLRDVSKTHSE